MLLLSPPSSLQFNGLLFKVILSLSVSLQPLLGSWSRSPLMMLFAAMSDVRITAYVFVPWVSDQSLWREGEEFSLLKNMSNNKKVIKGRRVSTPVLSNAFALEEPNSCEGPPEVLLPRHLTLDNLAHERIPHSVNWENLS